MKKEIIICSIVIISVIVLNVITQNYTKQSLGILKEDLKEIEENLKSENNEDLKEKIENINKEWMKRYDKMAYYIEHDELEKVKLYLVGLEINAGEGEYTEAIVELNRCEYILEHIEEKYSINLKNIF